MELVSRVVRSPLFSKSARLQEFLVYACKHALAGENVHEQQIGHEIFKRASDYPTSEDNIVRVAGSQLRKRLDEYFATEGKNEPITISLPKGSYMPVFRARVAGGNAKSAISVRMVASVSAVILLVASLAASAWLWNENRRLRSPASAAHSSKSAVATVWGPLLRGEQHTLLVAADSSLALLQDTLHVPVSLREYTNREYISTLKASVADPKLKAWVQWMGSRQHTSFGDLTIARRILDLARDLGGEVTLRYARDLTTRDLKSYNIILLGSRRSNPWVEIFESRMNFRSAQDERTATPYFVNTSPQKGEPATFGLGSAGGALGEAYSVVALLPNLAGSGNVMLIEGASMEGTETAGEWITSETFCGKLVERLGVDKTGRIPYFEVLVRSVSVGGAGGNTQVVAHRLVSDQAATPAPSF